MRARDLIAPAAVAIALVLSAALDLPKNILFLIATVFVYGIAALGLAFIYGHGGMLSIGHGAIVGAAAYAAIGASNAGVPLPVTAVVCLIVGGITAFAFGLPTVRLHGHYFAITTFAAAETMRVTAENLPAIGATAGLTLLAPRALGVAWLSNERNLLYVAAAIYLVAAAGSAVLKGSVFGRQLLATRENETLARAVGIPLTRTKLLASVVSGAVCGAAGLLFGLLNTYVAPDHVGASIGVTLILILIVGGTRHWLGPLTGAAVYVALPNLTAFSPLVDQILIGLALIAAVLLVPEGIVPAVSDRVYPAIRRLTFRGTGAGGRA